jgi:hypothetical protein
MIVQSARMEGRVAAMNAILGATRHATYDVVVGIARYDDLLRPVADGRPTAFAS